MEVLPYLLTALVVALVVPWFVYSLMTVALPGVFYTEARGTEAMVMSDISDRGENAFELIREDHDAFVSNKILRGLAKTAETNLVNS